MNKVWAQRRAATRLERRHRLKYGRMGNPWRGWRRWRRLQVKPATFGPGWIEIGYTTDVDIEQEQA